MQASKNAKDMENWIEITYTLLKICDTYSNQEFKALVEASWAEYKKSFDPSVKPDVRNLLSKIGLDHLSIRPQTEIDKEANTPDKPKGN